VSRGAGTRRELAGRSGRAAGAEEVSLDDSPGAEHSLAAGEARRELIGARVSLLDLDAEPDLAFAALDWNELHASKDAERAEPLDAPPERARGERISALEVQLARDDALLRPHAPIDA
jgi:hypothetical protein